MQELQQFFSMGGYARYVWSAYGITTVVLIVTAVWPMIRRRQLQTELRKRWLWENDGEQS